MRYKSSILTFNGVINWWENPHKKKLLKAISLPKVLLSISSAHFFFLHGENRLRCGEMEIGLLWKWKKKNYATNGLCSIKKNCADTWYCVWLCEWKAFACVCERGKKMWEIHPWPTLTFNKDAIVMWGSTCLSDSRRRVHLFSVCRSPIDFFFFFIDDRCHFLLLFKMIADIQTDCLSCEGFLSSFSLRWSRFFLYLQYLAQVQCKMLHGGKIFWN